MIPFLMFDAMVGLTIEATVRLQFIMLKAMLGPMSPKPFGEEP